VPFSRRAAASASTKFDVTRPQTPIPGPPSNISYTYNVINTFRTLTLSRKRLENGKRARGGDGIINNSRDKLRTRTTMTRVRARVRNTSTRDRPSVLLLTRTPKRRSRRPPPFRSRAATVVVV